MRHDLVVLAYHGCDAAVAERLFAGEPFQRSENDYDWLGSGVYFWEYGADRALRFARDQQRRGKVTQPAVVGALVQLGNCFDLLDTAYTRDLASAFREYRIVAAQSEWMLPRNAGSTPDKKLRRLDCSVLNFYLDGLDALWHDVRHRALRLRGGGARLSRQRDLPGEPHPGLGEESGLHPGRVPPHSAGMDEGEVDETAYEFSERFFEYDEFGRPLDPDTYRRRQALKKLGEMVAKMTREEARAYLVKLGTHNPDGTLTEQYADDGEPSKYRPTD